MLQVLEDAGIKPNGDFYSLDAITTAIEEATGYTPTIICNVNTSGYYQMYEIYMCTDTSGSDFIECPVSPTTNCPSTVLFPPFVESASAARIYLPSQQYA
ncbi:PREDICTED: intracellular ribonuclease LX-like isoform X2 [Nelumbo nucifera]|uniref:Intracellular ribonuclease LX-like isoform X2 n=2 Tax=Nelumbo nucifera TaxID=4432 RepID=A0A1U7ZLA1_NELNU|nr:PREDICTED: intracellular ribonuclease LX-like isoform X2 [Nelumbo nucifera]